MARRNRLQIDATDQTVADLERILAARDCASNAEVVRRLVHLGVELCRIMEEDGVRAVPIVRKDGTVERILF